MLKSDPAKSLLTWLQSQLAASDDICLQNLESKGKKAQFFYIKSICDQTFIQDYLLIPFFEIDSFHDYMSYLDNLFQTSSYINPEKTLNQFLHGSVVFISGTKIRLIDTRKVANTGISEAKIESTVQGPQNSFSEDIATNLNMIRDRYYQPSLRIENQEIGHQAPTPIAILYDEKLVDPLVLEGLRQRLAEIQKETSIILSNGQLHRHLSRRKKTMFPTLLLTERPDRVAYNLAQGKIAIIMQGNAFVLLLPSVFYDFMASMDDLYHTYWTSRFVVILRYLGLFITITLPSLYVVSTAYNPELFRYQLALTIAGSRISVPYPAFIEVFLMLLMMEFLTEASLRLPKMIGSTATTVGGLILGQAATEAALVSNIMVILIAAVAISNFVIPINAMGFAMRGVKYLLLFISTVFGMIGFIVGLVGIVAYLVHLDSFGQPYLRLFMKSSTDQEEIKRVKEEKG